MTLTLVFLAGFFLGAFVVTRAAMRERERHEWAHRYAVRDA